MPAVWVDFKNRLKKNGRLTSQSKIRETAAATTRFSVHHRPSFNVGIALLHQGRSRLIPGPAGRRSSRRLQTQRCTTSTRRVTRDPW